MPRKGCQALLFAGSSHPKLAAEVAQCLGVELGDIAIGYFPDGEISVQIKENVRGQDVFVLQTIARHPNRYLMELLLIVDALKRSSAKSIVAVIPYYGYARQDRRDKPRVPITAKLVADLLTAAGVSHVVTMDLHAEQLQGFFNLPVDGLYARPKLANAVKTMSDRLTVATPDVGSVKLARAYATELGVGMVIVDKERVDPTTIQATTVIGTVEGKDILLADDMVSTGGTLASAAKACHEKGARRIFAVATHGLFVGEAVRLIEQSPIELLFVSNTVPEAPEALASNKIRFVSVANLFGQAIQCIVSAESISSLFKC